MIGEVINDQELLYKIAGKIFPEDILRRFAFAKMILDKPRFYTEDEVAEKLNVSVTTVRRDCQRLRNTGINIHSRKMVFEIVNMEKLSSLSNITEYKIAI